ncbi:hypothetical protein PILCRDRAFT_823963 [Piloderma croceum F 1598]|uniref:Uncharacterized protein n=1 Tax=Piloderma croceum (strain F 1598) TaxID=765440 RepID=A0A0C3FGA0_PILCF|nr:hypothetical protein PILCRDRAFT_823963 [Piloderma croceum F 1598]
MIESASDCLTIYQVLRDAFRQENYFRGHSLANVWNSLDFIITNHRNSIAPRQDKINVQWDSEVVREICAIEFRAKYGEER